MRFTSFGLMAGRAPARWPDAAAVRLIGRRPPRRLRGRSSAAEGATQMRLSSACLVALASGALVATIAACGGGADVSSFERDGFPFTFEYPTDFKQTEDVSFTHTLGGGASGETVALALDHDNMLILQSNTLSAEVDANTLPLAKSQFDRVLWQVDPAADGEEGETGGFPSLAYDAVELNTVRQGQSRITILFDGTQNYVINCQSTRDDRDEVRAACDEALETLKPRKAA